LCRLQAEPHPIELRKGETMLHTLNLSMPGVALAAAFAATMFVVDSQAHGVLPQTQASVEIVDRTERRVLPMYRHQGRRYVVGKPGNEYTIRVRNGAAGRILAVMSVDGVNVITGDTASMQQSGYVLAPYESADIAGWRKSMARTAAFYFTALPDSYAARTGRPDNVGVIGVAVFRERARPIVLEEFRRKDAGRESGGERLRGAIDAGAPGHRPRPQRDLVCELHPVRARERHAGGNDRDLLRFVREPARAGRARWLAAAGPTAPQSVS